jgi:inhibitor of KinA
MEQTHSITSLNECAALVSFGNRIDEVVNRRVIALHQRILAWPFPGFIESVPAYASLTAFYNLVEVRKIKGNHPTAADWVKDQLEKLLAESAPVAVFTEVAPVEIPVWYEGEDLELVSHQHRLTPLEVIAIHTSKTYRVFMIGFLPGFPYLGTVDERIATPRKNTPRTKVPPGSVGIAGFQTGIYPQASPGGWQLIGKTPIKIFDATRTSPCLLGPGDSVRFYAINQNEFEKRNEY